MGSISGGRDSILDFDVVSVIFDGVGAKTRSLAIAIFADRQQRRLWIGHNHTHQLITCPERDTFDTTRVPARWTSIRFTEANSQTVAGGQDDFVPRLGHNNIDELVIVSQFDRDDTSPIGPAVPFEGGLFHETFLSRHDEEVTGQVKIADGAAVGNLFAFAQIQQIDDGAAAAFTA